MQKHEDQGSSAAQVSTEQGMAMNGTMGSYSSRTADKFVIRLPPGMRRQVQSEAVPLHISMNSWILQAIDEKLDRDQRAHKALDALVVAASSVVPRRSDG